MASDDCVRKQTDFYDPTAVIVDLQDYEKEFRPSVFLSKYYNATSPSDVSLFLKHKLQCFHESFLTVPDRVKVLDYGAGPSVALTISAATKASEIVLADYCEENLKFLSNWLNFDPDAFDWSPYFAYVVQNLEGKDEYQARERQDQVRKITKAVVHCDINHDPPIERGYDGLYDVVMCSLVIAGVSRTPEKYSSNILRLSQLVKPGGRIFFYDAANKIGYYTIGDRNFPNIYTTDEFALTAFRDAGFVNISVKHCYVGNPDIVFRFISAKKS